MLVVVHVLSALASLASSGMLLLSPSQRKLKFNSVLILLTFTSGSLLILRDRDHIIQACSIGLIYLGISSLAVTISRHKLAKQKT